MSIDIDQIKSSYRQSVKKINIELRKYNFVIGFANDMYIKGEKDVEILIMNSCRDNSNPLNILVSCGDLIGQYKSDDLDYIHGWCQTLNYIFESSYHNLIRLYTDN